MWPWSIKIIPYCQWRGELIPTCTHWGLFLALYTAVTSSKFSFTTSTLQQRMTGVWAFYCPKPERSQDMVLQRCKAASRKSLHWGPAERCCHIDQKIGEVCKMHLSWLKALYIHRIILTGSCSHSKYEVPILKEKLLFALDVSGTSSDLLTFSM